MSTTAKFVKDSTKAPKYAIRARNRCKKCGRSRAYLRKFALCRLCFRELALRGEVAGVIKSSW
jgi:small subunit ribosomal protein S14